MKDYILVSICDPDLCEQGIHILHNFLTIESLKFQIYEVKFFILIISGIKRNILEIT